MDKELDYRDSIDDWAAKYEKAEKDGVFKDADEKRFSPNKKNSTDSFFGMSNSNSQDSEVDLDDAKYWSDVSRMADVALSTNGIISEEIHTPNPVTLASVGKDQDATPEAIDSTFSNEDLETLEELKKKLHDLQVKVADMTAESAKANKDKIESLKNQIDELSDSLTGTEEVK